MATMETREVFLPARVLEACMPEWETADDAALSRAVGEAMEHAYWHWRWVMAIRQYQCRLVVVQHKEANGVEMMPHYQLGDLFTLSQWHPERALVEAQTLVAESGDGLTFDLPVDKDMIEEWEELARASDLDEENALEILACGMVLLDEAHDAYVEELGDGFYVATRGVERDLDRLLMDGFGRWSSETMQVVDKVATVAQVYIFTEQLETMKTPVPLVFQPEAMDDADEGDAASPVKVGGAWNG